jgi:predicted transcriptional regulator
MEGQNDYEAFFNSCNAPLESALWMDDLQTIVEAESRNSKEQFFLLCMKRKLADPDHSYKYSSSSSTFEEINRTAIKSLEDLEKIELTEDFINDTDTLMKEM